MQLSFIIPACNEEDTLNKSFNIAKKFLDKLGRYEIIIAVDGSTDRTKTIADEIAANNKMVRLMYSKKRLGKGLALKRAFRIAKSKIIIFSDADLSADISQTKNMISEIRKGADICIGSRYMPRAKTNRSLTRRITSNTYVFFVKLPFNTKITDFQCGFKAFIKKALPIILKAKDNRWFWDTEMLLKSERKGLKIKQMPVHWKASKNSKVNLLKTSFYLFYKLLRFRINTFYSGFT